MRFLHTADWHIGKYLRGRLRLDEQEQVLAEILQIARAENVDCLLVAGDLFDSQAPSPDSERLVYDFFAELAGNRIPAIVIGGNHDHPRRLAAHRHLLEHLRVYVRSEPTHPNGGGVIEFEADGDLAKIAVLPFVAERKIVDACMIMGPEVEWYAEYAERVSQMFTLLAESFSEETINIVVAHLFIYGAETSGSEYAVHVSHPYAIAAQRLPSIAHYIALGHLHRPQQVDAPSSTCYAGSTLQLDFGEQGQQKRVVIVDAAPGKPAKIESVNLAAGRKLRDIIGTIDELEKNQGQYANDFLKVTVKVDAPVPGIADRIRQILPNAVDIRMDYPRTEEKSEEQSMATLTPEAIFARFYRVQHRANPPEDLARMFHEIFDEVSHATD